MRIVSSHSFYSTAAHDEVLTQWQNAATPAEPLELDLSSAQFFDPYGIVALVIFLNTLPDGCLPVNLKINGLGEKNGADRAPVSYLTRMGFWEEIGSKISVPAKQLPVRPNWQADKNALVDITILHSLDAIAVMLRKTGEILQNLGFTPVGRGHVLEVLSELSSNVLDHAQSEIGGVVTTQTYKSKGNGRYLVISIGDAGIGVRASLGGNDKLASRLDSDAQALGVAVGLGNSRYGSGGRGGGLPRVLDIARRYEGRVAMRSGAGALAFRGADDQKRSFDAPFQLGTQLRILLPENRLMGG